MNCKFHPTAEAVTTCAVCGAEMCWDINLEIYRSTLKECTAFNRRGGISVSQRRTYKVEIRLVRNTE